MKHIKPKLLAIVLLLLIGLPSSSDLIAQQPCGSPASCDPNRKFPYYFCEGGELVEKCSSDPNNEPNATVYKLHFPLCASLNTFNARTNSTVYTTEGQPVDVTDETQWVAIVNEAVDAWTCLCPNSTPNSEKTDCCIEIEYSTRDEDFEPTGASQKPQAAITALAVFPPDCRALCENGVLVQTNVAGPDPVHPEVTFAGPRIYLNNTTNFTEGTAGLNVVSRAFYTGAVLPGFIDFNGFTLYSLRDIIKHELGHFLGLGHPDDPDCYPGVNESPLMNTEIKPNKSPGGLTALDKCHYMKLYCPVTTSVQWDDIKSSKSQSDALLLSVRGGLATVTGTECENMQVRVFSLDGRDLGLIDALHNPALGLLMLNMTSINSGVVVLTFTCPDQGTVTKRVFMIEHADK